MSEHGYFFTKKFLVLAPAVLASLHQTCAFNDFCNFTFMKIIYIANTRLPTEKAHGLATMKICEAFARTGASVELVVPKLWRRSGDPFLFYGVKPNFKINKIFCFDFLPFLPRWLEWLTFFLQMISFSLFTILYFLFKKRDRVEAVFFSHDYMPLFFVSLVASKIFYDIHHFPGKNFMYRRVMNKSFGFAVQTRWKIEALRKDFGIPEKRVVYWPNGTDVEKFSAVIPKNEVRKKLGLPIDEKIVLYTGALFNWKGVETLILAIDKISPVAKVYLVGGATADVEDLKKRLPEANDERVVFVPFQPHELMPFWCQAADVLILPNTGKQKVSLYYTSPMKLFEYISSGTPLVVSNIPSIAEIVDDGSAFLAEADNPMSFAEKVNLALSDAEAAKEKAARAVEKSKFYTWDNRAVKILTHINHLGAQLPSKKRILVIPQLTRIGDLVAATAVFDAIKKTFPDCRLAVLAATQAAGIVRQNPDIDELIIYDSVNRFSLMKKIRKGKFDVGISLSGTARSSLLMFFGLIPTRIKLARKNRPWAEWLTDWLANIREFYPHSTDLVAFYLKMLRHIGVDKNDGKKKVVIFPEAETKVAEFFRGADFTESDKIIGLSITAGYNKTKEWGIENFALLMEKISTAYQNVKFVVVGAKSDKNKIADLRKLTKIIFAEATDFSLEELPTIIKKCSVFICGNTGPMHIADALEVPLVVINGPVDTKELVPRQSRHILVLPEPPVPPTIFAFKKAGSLELTKKALDNTTVKDVFRAFQKIFV